MPPITRKGDFCTGHEACPARPAKEGEPTVSGQPVVRQGHAYVPHSYPEQAPHGGMLATGAPYVTIGGYEVGRIGDAISCGGNAAQGEQRVTVGNLGGDEDGRALEFEILKEGLKKRKDLTSAERLALCMSDIAAAESLRQTRWQDAHGWQLLSDWMRKWFTSPGRVGAETGVPSWIDWDWALEFEHVRNGLEKISEREYLFNEKALKSLVANLKRDDLFNHPDKFDYTLQDWKLWYPKGYFQRYDIKTPPEDFLLGVNGFEISVGNCTLRALPKGEVKTIPGGYKIIITDVSIVLMDTLGFEDWQPLGRWNCDERRMEGVIPWNLENQDFQDFRKKTGFGGDFHVLAKPRPIDMQKDFVYDYLP